jgi:hypothetical protein
MVCFARIFLKFGFSVLLFLICIFSYAQNVQFDLSTLRYNGFAPPVSGTSIKFGPDGRLYLSELNGQIRIYTIMKTDPNIYTVVAAEVIFHVQNIPNHDDTGTLAWDGRSDRQVTGIAVVGTAENPIVYVSSSDPKWGGPTSHGGDRVLDTNSGIITKLSRNGSSWEAIDLVRGLPRSEENHSTNGMEYVNIKGKPYLIVTSGGNTNAGSPGKNFAYTVEYALSSAVLSIDLNAIEALPTKTDPRYGRKYKYDIPTLDDPSRPNVNGIYDPNDPNYDGIDVGDPFGGNDGLNMAMIVPGGPVQIFSGGYRNTYDIVVTQAGKVFVTDNGPNANWGGMPEYEANPLMVNNNYLNTEPGNNSTNPSPSGEFVDNQDHILKITNDIQNYTFGSFYGGHPTPIRANPGNKYTPGAAFPYNPGGAGLYTRSINDDNNWTNITPLYTPNAVFRTQILKPVAPNQPGFDFYAANSLPANWPPVPIHMADPNESDFRAPGAVNPNGPQPEFLTIIKRNSNGIDEYSASTFGGAIKGALVVGRNQGYLHLVTLNPDGSLKTLEEDKWNLNGGNALGIDCLGDDEIFPGTIWVATFNNKISILTPVNVSYCPSPDDIYFDPNADYDNDGYTNQDEIDNGTDYCSGASKPNDFDQDFVSDLNDLDDDGDGIPDHLDPFQLGSPSDLPVNNELFSDKIDQLGRPYGYLGLGLTGLMNNGQPNPNWLNWLDVPDAGPLPNDIYGGAAGAIQLAITGGTANGTANNQHKGFQFGLNVGEATGEFVITGGLLGLSGPQMFYDINHNGEIGIQMGDGTQSNFLKLVFTKTQIVAALEINDVPDSSPLILNIPTSDRPNDSENIDFILRVNPVAGTVEPQVKIGNRPLISLGTKVLSGKVLESVKNINKPLAVGMYGTTGIQGVEFLATYDYFKVSGNQPFILSPLQNLSRQVGSPAKEIDLKDFFGDNNGAENLNFTVSGKTNNNIGTSINGSLLTVSFPSSPQTGSITIRATDSSGLYIEQTFEVNVIPAERIMTRINAGGLAVAGINGSPNWKDNSSSGAVNADGYSVNKGTVKNAVIYWENKHSSIPAYIDEVTFEGIFANERESEGSGNMVFNIPVTTGEYKVNLYLANSATTTSTVGSRVFDVKMENSTVMSNVDLIQRFGQRVGGMIQATANVSDGSLTIEFVKKTGNPLVSAIEIISTGIADPIVITNPITDQKSVVGEELDGNLMIAATGGVGTITYSAINLPPGIDIESVNGRIYGIIQPEAIANSPYQVIVKATDGNSPIPNEEFITFTWTIDTYYSWKTRNENQSYTARHENSFVQAGERFYMMGGRENANTVDVYDYNNDSWKALEGVAPLRFNHFQATEYKGYIWVIGAFQNNAFPDETPATHIWIFDPVKERYIRGPAIPEPRRRGSAGMVLYKDKFYIVGGNRLGHNGQYVDYFDEYDPSTGVWTVLPSAPRPRDHFQAALIGNKIYVASGRLSGGPGGTFAPVIKEVDVYDFETGSWSTLPSSLDLPTGRAAAVVANFENKLLVAGGETPTESNALALTEIFDPNTQSWSTGPSLNFPRHGTQGILSGKGLFVAGGSPTRGGGNQRNMEYFGINNPSGIPLVENKLSGPNQIQISANIATQVNLEISGGNQAVFIDTMYFAGTNFNQFAITSGRVSKSITKTQGQHEMIITYSGSQEGVQALLVIKYGNNQLLEIPLVSSLNNTLSNGLRGFWKMEEGSGNVLLDISGKGNHATLLNASGVTWPEGKDGLSVNLTGSTGRYGVVNHNESLDLRNALTISAWIRPEGISAKRILSKGSEVFELGILNSKKIEFRLNRNTSGTNHSLSSIQDYPSDGQTWMHVAVTFDGSKSTIFINGEEDNSVIYQPFTINASTAQLQIGARSGVDRWKGGLDEVRLYDRALSNNEVKALYAGQLQVPEAPTLTFPHNEAVEIPTNTTLTWEPSALASSYRIQLSRKQDFETFILDQTTSENFLTTPDLLANTVFFWRVSAINQSGESPWSLVKNFRTTQTNRDADLVGHWKMEEGSGNVLIDYSGYENDATLINTQGIFWIEGYDGLAIKLNGLSGRYGTVTHNPSLDIRTEITISAWIRPSGRANKQILSKSGPDGYELSIYDQGTIEFRFNRESNGSTYRLRSNSLYPTDGSTWMHVAVTFNGTKSTIYINGVEDISKTYPTTVINSNTTSLQIGARNGNNRWDGDLDEVRLYKRALSPSEIASIFNGETPLPHVPELLSPTNGGVDISLNPTLSWSPAAFASSYKVQMSSNNTFNTLILNQTGVETTAIQSVPLEENKTYYWRVASTNSKGDSNWSEIYSFTTEKIKLVGFWKMEEGSGTVLLDASGKGNHANLINAGGVTWPAGKEGLSVSLTGSTGRYGAVNHNESLDIRNALTISAWIRPEGISAKRILSKGSEVFELGILNSRKIEFRLNRNTSGTNYSLSSMQDYPSDGVTWMHVAVTFDGSKSTIFINGKEDNSAIYQPFTINASTSQLQIGARSGIDRWQGGLDEVMLFNKALSPSEIQNLFNNPGAAHRISIIGKTEKTSDTNVMSSDEELQKVDLPILTKLYPNPVSDVIYVDWSEMQDGNIQVSIFDMKGIRLFDQEISVSEGKIALDIANLKLKPGNYMLILNTEGYPKIFRFLKK